MKKWYVEDIIIVIMRTRSTHMHMRMLTVTVMLIVTHMGGTDMVTRKDTSMGRNKARMR